MLAAVDRQRRAGDEARILIDEEGNASSDLLRLAEASNGDPGDDLAEYFLRNRGDHVRIDIARCDGVHRDVAPRAFLRERLGEAMDARFGGRIIDLAILPRLA